MPISQWSWDVEGQEWWTIFSFARMVNAHFLSPLKSQSQPLNKWGNQCTLSHGDGHVQELTSDCQAESSWGSQANSICRSPGLELSTQNVLLELTEIPKILALIGSARHGQAPHCALLWVLCPGTGHCLLWHAFHPLLAHVALMGSKWCTRQA